MLKKPDACRGCPLDGDGWGFVPDEIREDADVLVLAQNPGSHEEMGERVTGYYPGGRGKYSRAHPIVEACEPAPLIGPTGYMLTNEYLPIAGLSREQVSLANVLKCRVQLPKIDKKTGRYERTNDMPTGITLASAVQHCTRAYLRIPAATRLTVAMGAHAARFQGMSGSIYDWRGFLLP